MELGDGQACSWAAALGCEWMRKKVVLGLLFVGFEGVVENKLEVR